MDEKNAIMEGFGEFLLGLVKVCAAIALLTVIVVASAFLAIQGTFVVLDKYEFRGIATELIIVFIVLMLACDMLHDKLKQNKVQRIRNAVQAENDQQGPKDENETYERCASDKARSVEVCSS